MKASRIAWIVLAGLLVAGCRSGGNTELLERELRLQEDKIYKLHDALDDCHGSLESARRENEALKQQLAGGPRGPAEELPPGIVPPPPPAIESPSDRFRGRGDGGLQGPLVEPGPEGTAEPQTPEPPDSNEAPPARKPPAKARGASLNQRASRIALNQQLTGPMPQTGKGEEGILVVFEPQNSAGQLVNAPGDVSIVVLDRAQQGDAARVARWDFSSAESSNFFHKTAPERGFRFELPWPGPAPTSRDLHLFVRMTTADGHKLAADSPLDSSKRDAQTRGNWSEARVARTTPRSSETSRPAATQRDSAPERPVWTPYR